MNNDQKYKSNQNEMEFKLNIDNYLNKHMNDDSIIKLISYTDITSVGNELFNIMNINNSNSNFERIAEYCSRITYLAFKEDKIDDVNKTKQYLTNIIQNKGHRSILNSFHVTFGINGKYVNKASNHFQSKLIEAIYGYGGNVYIEDDNRNMLITLNLKQIHQVLSNISKDLKNENDVMIVKDINKIYHEKYPIAISAIDKYLGN